MPTRVHTPAGSMTATQAAYVASRARKLLRVGHLSHHAYAVLDALLWASRRPGGDSAMASYSRLQSLAHVARGTVAKAVAQLETLGLVQRLKRRALVLWHNGGRAWRQMPNVYRFVRCEFTPRPESQKQEVRIIRIEPSSMVRKAAEAALAARRRVIEERLLIKR